MNKRTLGASALAVAFALSFGLANASTALSVHCTGSASTSSITWSATAAGGVLPVSLVWSNGATSSTQKVAHGAGTYTLSLIATDASSSVATTSCSATVAAASTSTSGTSTSAFDAQIQALLAQIAALKQQLAQLIASHIGIGSSTGTSTPAVIPPGQIGKTACVSLTRDLSEGDQGDDVMSIQEMLSQDPAYGFSAQPTGFFGPLTKQAMQRYQQMNGIASSSVGFVGPLTRGFFERHCGEGLQNQEMHGQSDATSSNATSSEGESMHPMIPAPMPGHSGDSHGNGNGDN